MIVAFDTFTEAMLNKASIRMGTVSSCTVYTNADRHPAVMHKLFARKRESAVQPWFAFELLWHRTAVSLYL